MKKGFTAIELIIGLVLIPLIAAGLTGWVLNIMKLVHMDHIVALTVVRAIGIFIAPLGAVMGYIAN